MNDKLFLLLNCVFGILGFFSFLFSAIQLSVRCEDSSLSPGCSYEHAQQALLMIASLIVLTSSIIGFCTALIYLIAFFGLVVALLMTFIFMVAYRPSENYKNASADGRNGVYAQQMLIFGVEVTLTVLSLVLFADRKYDLHGWCRWDKRGCSKACDCRERRNRVRTKKNQPEINSKNAITNSQVQRRQT